LDIYIPPLLEIDSELAALDYHLNLIEEHIRNKEAFERIKSRQKIKKLNLTSDDPKWHYEKYELDYIIDFLLPRLFRGPFLVSLYAVYESAVIEIAKLFQAQKGIEFSIMVQKGKNFLDKAKKYYEQIIYFQLYSDEETWKRIIILSKVRNAIAHANGRIEMLKPKAQENIKNWENQNIGISSMSGFVVIEENFLRETLRLVSASLNDLVERYKQWDDYQKTQAGKPVPPE
jgi:hypothetical protein